jgi:hypothetical protein
MSLRKKLEAHASVGRRAYKIVDALFAGIIAALRRDPRFGAVTVSDLDLLLRDPHIAAEKELMHELRDRVHLDDLAEDDR